MFSLESLRDLYRHMEWADSVVWTSVMQSEEVRGADAALLAKLRHLHRTQQFFLKVWRGEEVSRDQHETTLGEELTMARAWHRDVWSWLDTIEEPSLAGKLSMPWADRMAQRAGAAGAHPTRLGETLYQVPAHSTYHRGQVNLLLRQAGVDPPNVDYIAWVWLGRPEPRWP